MPTSDYLSSYKIICIYFLIWPILESRAEIQKYFRLFFGSNEAIQKFILKLTDLYRGNIYQRNRKWIYSATSAGYELWGLLFIGWHRFIWKVLQKPIFIRCSLLVIGYIVLRFDNCWIHWKLTCHFGSC